MCDSYPEFILDAMKEDECLAELQFKKVDIPLLAEALWIPAVFNCPQGSVWLNRGTVYRHGIGFALGIFVCSLPVVFKTLNHIV